MSDSAKARLRAEFERLDPVRLLQEIRSAQQVLADFAAHGTSDPLAASAEPIVTSFLEGLATAWQRGEVRPTHCKQPGARHWWKTRADPFEQAWPLVEQWLTNEPTATAKELMDRLAKTMPDVYADTTQLRTLQRRVRDWRTEQARALVLGHLREIDAE